MISFLQVIKGGKMETKNKSDFSPFKIKLQPRGVISFIAIFLTMVLITWWLTKKPGDIITIFIIAYGLLMAQLLQNDITIKQLKKTDF